MFGQTGGFGSTGTGFGQQPQQGQQTGGLFGQTSTGFGQPQQQQTGGMFGQTQQPGQTGGLFGQPAQPAQQSTGLFGGSTPGQTNAFGSTGGAFGASTGTFGQQQQARPAFGATGSTGGGLFGGASTGSTFGGSTGFGANNNAAPATGGLFGSTSTGFGAKPATTGFGAPAQTGNTGGLFGAKPAGTGMFGGGAQVAGPVTNGTAGTAYQPVKEKDGNTNNYTVYQTITCMDAYKGASLEELRLQDYEQNRKTAPPPGTNAFGAGSSTGGMFGQPAQQQSTGLFGAAQPASTGFGTGASTGLFGQPAQPAGTTAFGQPQQSTGFGAPAASTGLFGSNTQSTGTGLFGQQNQQQPQQQTGGLFGQQNQQSGGLFGQTGSTGTTGGLFGSNTGTSTTGGGLFGQQQQQNAQPAASGAFSFGANNQNQAKPAFGGFGTGSTTTNTFGQPAAQGASTGFGFGQTGQQAQPQAAQQPSTGFGFGAQSTTAAPQTGGLFGSQPQQQNQQSGGLFGAKPAGGLFGSTTGTTNTFGAPAQTQGQTGGGLFGAAQPAQPAGQQPSGGLFGNTGTNTFGAAKPGGLFGQPAQTGTTGGLFGNNSTNTTTGFGQPAAQPSTGLFGSTNQQTGGGLFGNLGASQQGQQNQTGQTGGLFGAKPNNAGSGLFGQTNTGSTLGASTGGSGLFGNSFGGGAQQQNQQNMGGSLFGNSSTNQLQQSQAQPPVNIDVNNPYGTGGMFSVPPSFQPINVSTGPKVLPPLSSSLRPAPSAGKMTPRFRGISTPARAASTLPTGSILGVSTASNGSPARNLFSTPPPDTLSPAAFTPRQGVKKLVLHRKTDSLSLSTAVANRTPQISRSILNPEADHDGTSVNGSVMGNTVAGSRQASVARTQNDDAVTEKEHRRTDFSRKIDLEDYNDGDYYTIPEMSELYNASNEDLSSVEDFVVGRKGYGRLTYLEPVDIGNKTTLNRICGDLVTFRDGKCEVYPEKADERPPGEGLNHRAEISLEDCWPRNKETQQPITDPKHPKQRARERALRHVPDTTFQSYNPSTGVWVFTVEHFTLYGIPEEDDSDDEEDEMDAQEDSVLNENGKRERSAGSERYGSYNGDEAAGSPSEIDRSSVAPSHADEDASEYARSSVQPVEIAVRQRDLIFTGMYGTPQPDDLDMTPRPNKKRLQFFRKAEKDLDGEVDGGDVDRSFFGATRTAPSKEREEWKMKRIESKNTITAGEDGAFLDAGLALGRIHRAALASTGHMFRLRQNQVISSLRREGKEAAEEREIMVKLLEFQLKHTNFIDEQGVPIAETDTKTRFKDVVELFRGDGRYEAELWRLGRALFDEIPTLANAEIQGQVRVDAESLVRKTALSDWLTSHLAPIVDREINTKDSGPQTVFSLLIANQVSRATSVAMDGGDLRLATLVAQAGSGPEFQSTMEQQLEVWRKQDVDAHIDVSYRRVYALLAGIVDTVEGGPSADQVEMSQGLSWLQALGMHLWFGTPLEQPLPDVINNFRAHLESEHPPARPVVTNSETEDAMYGMMKVFMEQATPAACLAGSAAYGKTLMDVRLQWHLLDLLVNVFGFGTSEEHVMESVRTFDRLSIDYASQLEREGLWEYAVFVLLHLDKEGSRLKAIKEVLGRHAAELADKEEILQRMSVPKEWLSEARADLYASKGDVYSEFLSCKQAGLMDRAHRIVLQSLAPEVILREDIGLLRKLLADLENARIVDWHKGGQVLLRYSDLCDRTKDLLNASEEVSEDLTEIIGRIPSLLESLERIYADDRSIDVQQMVCRTHMLAKVQKVATALASRALMTMPPLSRLLPEGDRLQVMQSASRDRLQRHLEALTA